MQIREKGKRLLLIRTKYDSDRKRTIGHTVASQDKYLSTVDPLVRLQLTKEEVDKLEKWLSSRAEKQSVDSLKWGLSYLPESVRRAVKALSVDGLAEGLTPEKADDIWLALDELKKALRKAGLKPPPRPGKVANSAPANDRQIPFTI